MKKLIVILLGLLLTACGSGSDGDYSDIRTSYGDIGQAACRHDAIAVLIVLAEKGYHTDLHEGLADDPQVYCHIQARALVRFDENGLPEPCYPERNDGCQWEYACIDNDNWVFICDQDYWYTPDEIWDSFNFASGNVKKIDVMNNRKHIN